MRVSLERSQSVLLLTTLLWATFSYASCITIEYPAQEKDYVNQYVTENRTETYTTFEPLSTIKSGEEILIPYILWSNPSLFFGEHKHIWYYGYNLSGFARHTSNRIRLVFNKQQYYQTAIVRAFDMSPRGQILTMPLISTSDTKPPGNVETNWITMQGEITSVVDWLNLANVKLNFARFLGGKSDLWLNKEGPVIIEFDTRGSTELAIIISGPSIPQNTRFSASLVWSDNVTEYIPQTRSLNSPVQVETRAEKFRTVIQTRQVPFWEIFTGKLP